MPEDEFRQMVRALFAEALPGATPLTLPYRQTWAESRDWYMTLSRLGWIAPAWPRELGGMGLPADKLIAYIEESEAWGVARPPDQGLVMVGPILMRFGTDAQRERFLPKILRGEHVWTQGYSEPNAGSDLAAVRTEAVLDGDHFIVNGQKTWTTWGSDGTHMFMLVRTDKTVKKQAGISFLLVDLKTPGITVRPIQQHRCGAASSARSSSTTSACRGRTWSASSIRDGRLPRRCSASSGFSPAAPSTRSTRFTRSRSSLASVGLFEDPAFVARFAELQLDTADLGAAYAAFAEIAKRGEADPAQHLDAEDLVDGDLRAARIAADRVRAGLRGHARPLQDRRDRPARRCTAVQCNRREDFRGKQRDPAEHPFQGCPGTPNLDLRTGASHVDSRDAE